MACVVTDKPCKPTKETIVSKMFYRTTDYVSNEINLGELKKVYNKDQSAELFVDTIDSCVVNTESLPAAVKHKKACDIPAVFSKQGNDPGPKLHQMDYPARGVSLYDLPKQNLALTLLHALVPILNGLQKLHRLNWFHNDLYETNVVVYSKPPRPPKILVIDFDGMNHALNKFINCDARIPPEQCIPWLQKTGRTLWRTKRPGQKIALRNSIVTFLIQAFRIDAKPHPKIDTFLEGLDLKQPFFDFIGNDADVQLYTENVWSTTSDENMNYLKATADTYALAGILLTILAQYELAGIDKEVLQGLFYCAKRGLHTDPFSRMRLPLLARSVHTLLQVNNATDRTNNMHYFPYFGVPAEEASSISAANIPAAGHLSTCNGGVIIPFRDISRLLAASPADLAISIEVMRAYVTLAAFAATLGNWQAYVVRVLMTDSTEKPQHYANTETYFLRENRSDKVRWTLYYGDTELQIENLFADKGVSAMTSAEHAMCALCTLLHHMDLIPEFPLITDDSVVAVFCKALAFQLLHGAAVPLCFRTNLFFSTYDHGYEMYKQCTDRCLTGTDEEQAAQKAAKMDDLFQTVRQLARKSGLQNGDLEKEKRRERAAQNIPPKDIGPALCDKAAWTGLYGGFHHPPVPMRNQAGNWCHLISAMNVFITTPPWVQFLLGLKTSKNYYKDVYPGNDAEVRKLRREQNTNLLESLITLVDTRDRDPVVSNQCVADISHQLFNQFQFRADAQQDAHETLTKLMEVIQATVYENVHLPSFIRRHQKHTCTQCGYIMEKELPGENLMILQVSNGQTKQLNQWLHDTLNTLIEKRCENPACPSAGLTDVIHNSEITIVPSAVLHLNAILYVYISEAESQLIDIQLDTPPTLDINGILFRATSHVRHSGYKRSMKSGHYFCNSFNGAGCFTGNDNVVNQGSLLTGRPVIFTYVHM